MEPSPQIPGYRIEAPIARGAQGAVYRATQLSLDRQVALKIVPRVLEETGARLLAKEAKVLAGLEHPNIVRVYDHGQAEGCSYMAMELLEGVDLERHLDSLAKGALAAPELPQQGDATVALDRSSDQTVAVERTSAGGVTESAAAMANRGDPAPAALRRIDHVLWTLEIASQLCDALSAVHAAGVLHRDLKPANIVMVEGRGPVITDFGTVHAPSRASYTQAAGFVGTPAYMSPEQANEQELDRRSDLYSLAATIYHCLAGRSPFAERSLTAVLIALERNEPEALRRINPAVPLAFAKVISKGMAKDVRDRFADIEEFSAALEKVRRGEKLGRMWTIPGLYRRTRRWHLPLAAGLLIGLVYLFWLDPSAAIRELIVADDLEQAAEALGLIPTDERDAIDGTLREDLPAGHQEALARVLAVVDGMALLRVRQSSRFSAAIGGVDRDFQIDQHDLPTEFAALGEDLLMPILPGYSYLYLLDHLAASSFSDGSPRVYYCPLKLEKQALRGPCREIDPEELPRRNFARDFFLADPAGEWIEFPAVSLPVTFFAGEVKSVPLKQPLLVHKFEAPRSSAYYYYQWASVNETRLALFAHPDETQQDRTDLLEALAGISGDTVDDHPLTISYWAAFRIAGYLGCRLPSHREWLLAVQEGEGPSTPSETRSGRPDLRHQEEADWSISKIWERSIAGLANAHTFPAEWTSSQSMASRGDPKEWKYCFFIFYMRDQNGEFVPDDLDIGTVTSPKGLRLVRDRFFD